MQTLDQKIRKAAYQKIWRAANPGNVRWASLAEQAANRRAREPGETDHTNVYTTKYGYYKVIIHGTYYGCMKTLEEALKFKDTIWLSLKAQ